MQKGNKLTEIKFLKSPPHLPIMFNITKKDCIAKADAKNLSELVKYEKSILVIFSSNLKSPLERILGAKEYLKFNFEKIGISVRKKMLNLIRESSKNKLNILDYPLVWKTVKYELNVFSPS
ncbi:MAG: hypothetical protein H7195_08435 [Chryseobacterium sp.]|nr:hypothetical protein [Chryseobacterium sp.]